MWLASRAFLVIREVRNVALPRIEVFSQGLNIRHDRSLCLLEVHITSGFSGGLPRVVEDFRQISTEAHKRYPITKVSYNQGITRIQSPCWTRAPLERT